MKHLVCMAVICMMGLATSWAQDSKVEKKPFYLSFNQLTNFLDLSPFQWEEVKSINDTFIVMQQKSLSGCPEQKDKQMQQAVDHNLKSMKKALTKDQYRKYISLLNVTNNNNRVIVFEASPDFYLADMK